MGIPFFLAFARATSTNRFVMTPAAGFPAFPCRRNGRRPPATAASMTDRYDDRVGLLLYLLPQFRVFLFMGALLFP